MSLNLVVRPLRMPDRARKGEPGEGPLGLTRGFMYAGAPRVAASLWKVPDVPTFEVMRRFYASMLTEGLTAAAALRKAQSHAGSE